MAVSFVERGSTRMIIIHNHVFKNAGSTIDWALQRNFGNAFVDHRDDKDMKRGAEYLEPYLLGNPWIKAVSTHHLSPPLPVIKGTQLLTIMMFRNPIERVTSVYNFERKQTNASTAGAKYARDHDLREYVLWRMRLDVPPTIRNFHIYRSISASVNWRKEVTEGDLISSMRFVDSVQLLGLVDRFDESMVLFEDELRPFFPNIDLSYRLQNAGQKMDVSCEKRIERLEHDIGEEAFKKLVGSNIYDIELYSYARKLFDERINNTKDMGAKLEAFRVRCKKQNMGRVSR